MSCNPSWLKSPIPTPPPLYTFETSNTLSVSDSLIILLKTTPDCSEDTNSNKGFWWSQAVAN